MRPILDFIKVVVDILDFLLKLFFLPRSPENRGVGQDQIASRGRASRVCLLPQDPTGGGESCESRGMIGVLSGGRFQALRVRS